MKTSPTEISVKIEESWHDVLEEEFRKPYFVDLVNFIRNEKQNNTVIYPPGSLIFNAFDHCPFDHVKVVILGQDPYHGPGQAMGLSFSVPKSRRIPPSLRNIYKEIYTDLGLPIPTHGDLSHWARQGVFLLNTTLTVEKGKPRSHANIGWQEFTNAVIHKLSSLKSDIVFLLWGRMAQQKAELVDTGKHHVLTAAHPSPLAGGAFFGNRHFSKTNQLLTRCGKKPIDWTIPDSLKATE